MPIEERIAAMIAQLDEIITCHREVRAVACEKITALDGRPPAPELQVLIRRIKRWATRKQRHAFVDFGDRRAPRSFAFVWYEYHPSAIVASVRPRGFKGKPVKEVMTAGVQMLYGMELGDLDQNVIDSIAVGHCHLCKTQEVELVGAPTPPRAGRMNA